MKHLSALDIAFLAKELTFLEGAKLQQVYQPAKKELILQFHVKGSGTSIQKVRVPAVAYLASSKEPAEKVTGFCQLLRKKLSGATLRSISQKGFERILQLDFASKNASFSLFFELFSKGNIILVQDSKIAAVEEKQAWKARTVAVGHPYIPPPAIADPRELGQEQLLQLLKATNKTDIVRFLALELSLGGLYAEELCLLAGIRKSEEPASLTAADAKKLLQSFHSLISSPPSPSIIYRDGKPLDSVPMQLRYYHGCESKPFRAFSEALEAYEALAPTLSKHDREIMKLNTIIEQQQDSIKISEAEAAEDSRRGELIYEHYQPIQQLLSEINAARKSGGWAAVRELQKKYKKLKVVDEKSASVVVEFQ